MVQFRKQGGGDIDNPEISLRSANARAAESGDNYCIEAVLSTEAPVLMFDRYDWEYMDEMLLASGRTQLDHVVLLNSHNRWSVDDVLGHIENIRTDKNGDTICDCCFDQEDEDALRIFKKYKNKHARAFSVGYTVLKFTDIAAGQSGIVDGKEYKAGPTRKLRVVTKWRVDEGSVVAIGADKKALSRSLEAGVSARSGLSIQLSEGDEDLIQRYADKKPSRGDAEKPVKPAVEVEPVAERVAEAVAQVIAPAPAPTVVININDGARTVDVDSGDKKTSSGAAVVPESGAEAPVPDEVPAESGGDEKRSDAVSGATDKADPVGISEDEMNARIQKAAEEGAKREAERRTAIRKAAEGLGLPQDVVDSCVDDPKCDEAGARAKFLDAVRAARSKPVQSEAPNVQHGRKAEGLDPKTIATALAYKIGGERAAEAIQYMNFRDAGRESIMTMRPMGSQLTEESRKAHERCIDRVVSLERNSVVSLMRSHLRAAGVNHDVDDEADVIMARSFSTPAINSIFTQVMGAVLLANIAEQGVDSTRLWTKDRFVPNFKQQEMHRFEASGLKRRNRGKEADHTQMADSFETIRASEYAQQFRVDRQDLIDDDLNAFATLASEWSRDVYNLRPSLVYGYLASNPALSDSVTLFHASRGNLITSAALSNASVQNAITVLGTRRGIGGQLLGLNEGVIICGLSRSFDVDQLINSSEVRNQTGTIDRGTKNPLYGRQKMSAYDARFDVAFVYPFDQTNVAAAPTVWYYAQKGGQYGINVAYLNGSNGLPVFRTSNLTGGLWGEQMDMNLDIGVGAEGPQGILRLSP